MTSLIAVSKAYKQAFKDNGIDIKIMPLCNGKQPRYPHTGGRYNDSVVENESAWKDWQGKDCNLGWLVNDQIFCIDIDGSGATDEEKAACADRYYASIDDTYDLSGAWIEKTRKGYHIIWKKPESMSGITKRIDALKNVGMPGIDIITQCQTEHDGVHTEGILAVYPSSDKKWISGHNPLDGNRLQEPPADMVIWLATELATEQATEQVTEQPKPAKIKVVARVKEGRSTEAAGNDAETSILKAILDVLPEKYYEDTSHGGDWNLWYRVMAGIQNIMGAAGYDTFCKFNKRATCWTDEMEQKNLDKWNKCFEETAERSIGIGSFIHWCKNDCPEQWERIKGDNLLAYQKKVLNEGTMYDLAKLACFMLDNIIYDTRLKRWVRFDNGSWDLSYSKLAVDLNEKVKPRFVKDMTNYIQMTTPAEPDTDADENPKGKKKVKGALDRKIKNMMGVASKYGNNAPAIITLMESISSQEPKYDENPWLVGFKDGVVYDLLKDEFRQGRMSDYVTQTLGCKSVDVMNVDPAMTLELERFLERILPYKEVRDYQLYLMALALNGIMAHRFACQSGTGANGKSAWMDLAKAAYGDYCKNVSTELYTTKLNTGGPKPELQQLKGKRFLIASEPGEGEHFNNGSLCILTGGDDIGCRGLFEGKIVEFKVTAQHNVLCNIRPDIKGVTGGSARRIININYPVKFVDNPDPNNPLEAKVDSKYRTSEWINSMVPSLISILIAIHKQAKQLGQHRYELEPPKSIMETTEDMISGSIRIKQFLEEEFDGCGCKPDPNGQVVKWKTVWEQYTLCDHFKSSRIKPTQKREREVLQQTSPMWASVLTQDSSKTYILKVKLNPKDNVSTSDKPDLNISQLSPFSK